MVTSTSNSSKAEQLLLEEVAPNGSIFQDLANSELATFVPDLTQQTLLKTESITIDSCIKYIYIYICEGRM